MLISNSDKKKVVVFPVKKDKKKSQSRCKRVLSLYFVLLSVAWFAIWFSQDSINAYLQQKYQHNSPFQILDKLAFWRAGGELKQGLDKAYASARSGFDDINEKWLVRNKTVVIDANVSQTIGEDKRSHASMKKISKKSVQTQTTENQNNDSLSVQNQSKNDNVQVVLKSGDKVLFAGDSIMQGIAPYLQKWLKSQYGIDSINLSKQSTGLSYPKFFDWPATIEQAFQSDPSIKLVVILVGPNDPWDFPDPNKANGMPFLKFGSSQWEQAYLGRVERIIQAAAKNGSKVIWLGIPHMKKEKLNEQMTYLESVLERGLMGKKDNVLFLPIAQMLSDDGSENYQDSMTLKEGEPPIRIRTKDGIHFTSSGQQFMSDYIASYIRYVE